MIKQPYFCAFSKCRRYRYVWRDVWDGCLPPCAFIGLNPSTADEAGPDPTAKRCINYAKSWSFGALVMLNLFAFRATDSRKMLIEKNPIGEKNDPWILREVSGIISTHGGMVIAAWGNYGTHFQRGAEVRRLLSGELRYLTLNESGEPGHPLYLKSNLKPIRWGPH